MRKPYAMEIHPLNMRDLTYVLANIRDVDWKELKAQLPLGTKRENLAQHVLPTINGPAFCVYYKDQPIAVFGASQSSIPTLYNGFAFGTNKFKRAVFTISHFTYNVLSHILVDNYGALRLEIRAHIEHKESNAWLQKMGFTKECECECFGTSGETFVLYSVTAKNYYKVFGIHANLQ